LSAPPKSLRLPEALLARVEAIAKSHGIKFSAAVRIALQRGVAALEREAEPEATTPRRRIISKGIS
jgi:hypothetical protein